MQLARLTARTLGQQTPAALTKTRHPLRAVEGGRRAAVGTRRQSARRFNSTLPDLLYGPAGCRADARDATTQSPTTAAAALQPGKIGPARTDGVLIT